MMSYGITLVVTSGERYCEDCERTPAGRVLRLCPMMARRCSSHSSAGNETRGGEMEKDAEFGDVEALSGLCVLVLNFKTKYSVRFDDSSLNLSPRGSRKGKMSKVFGFG
ncbi:hypothetical protein KC345_g202 [Hortaea werneckii]|nr:hypothetical protein KC345_g202 [Hortaea werneckii]